MEASVVSNAGGRSGVDVSVLVVSYNTRQETLACLRSVFEQTRRVSFEVIVIDNASDDGSAAAVAERFSQVQVIALTSNVGFAAANNQAAGQARGRYLLLLNPDTLILDGAIDRVVGFADQKNQTGLYGGRTWFADGRLNRNSCHGEPTPWSMLCMGLGLSSVLRHSAMFNPEGLGRWPRNTAREVDCITGCFLLVDAGTWAKLGGFDVRFFMYGEDTDLCIRARQMGYKCTIAPDAQLIHYGGRSERVRADKMIRLFDAKRQLIEKHWAPYWTWFGVAMLRGWAFSRWMAVSLLARVGIRDGQSCREWQAVWERRVEFSRGGAVHAVV